MRIDINDFKCFFCSQRLGGQLRHQDALRDIIHVECTHCGQYKITEEGAEFISRLPISERTKVGAYNFHHYVNPENRNKLITYFENKPQEETPDARILREILTVWWPRSIRAKLDLLLLNIGYSTNQKPSQIVDYFSEDFPKLFGSDWNEGYFYLQRLEEAGCIKIINPQDAAPRKVQLTLKGFDKLAELEVGQKNKDSNQVFVAMSFDRTLDQIFEHGIAPAIETCGYKPLRIDHLEHNEKICDKIEAAIRSSRFIVADFTFNRAGVYFETGLARGLGLQVIWTIKDNKDDIDQLHFDTRQYNHLRWNSEVDLSEKLVNRIKALGL
ncbi:MAG: hypothetical protein ACD_45C00426G0003 [uncultured bacterium]|nr:MAG: hypothetical protein ACD_45C00426G0003 [uncultured bacterium]